jgi:hypothetical protein
MATGMDTMTASKIKQIFGKKQFSFLNASPRIYRIWGDDTGNNPLKPFGNHQPDLVSTNTKMIIWRGRREAQ